MITITREMFDEIGPYYADDICIDDTTQDNMFRLFKCLPSHLQHTALEWDCSDSVFRDDAFEYFCKAAFDMTYDEYYKSEVYKKFSEYLDENKGNRKGMPQYFDWDKLEKVHV